MKILKQLNQIDAYLSLGIFFCKMVSLRYTVDLDYSQIPITPLDKCYSLDGRVFIQFLGLDKDLCRMVGVLRENVPGTRLWNVVSSPNAYEIKISLLPNQKSFCPLCRGSGWVNNSVCEQCNAEK